MNTFAAVVFCLAVANASAGVIYNTHEVHSLVNPAAHIPSGSVSVSADGAVIAGPAGSVQTNNGLHGHGAGAIVSGPAGDVRTHAGHAKISGPGLEHDIVPVHHAIAAPAVYAAPIVHAAPVATHTAVVGPSSHTTIIGAQSHATIIAPSAHHEVVAAPLAHHGVYAPSVSTWGHHGVYAPSVSTWGHHGVVAPAVATTWGHHGVLAHNNVVAHDIYGHHGW